MAFESPFFQSTQAQGIINNYLSGGGFSQPFPTPSTNPYTVDVDTFIPPSSQPTLDDSIPNCEELHPHQSL